MSYLTPVASLLLQLDKPVLAVLLDGVHLYGILSSIDQYGNLVLNDCYERVYCDFYYTKNELGTQIIQGNNVCLVSEIKGTLDNCPIEGMKYLDNEEFVTYMNMTDEEKLQYNEGKTCDYAQTYDYSISLVSA